MIVWAEAFEGTLLSKEQDLQLRQGHRALLSAIILQALFDACLCPMSVEIERGRNVVPEARSALAFFFHPDGTLEQVTQWLPFDASAVRTALRGPRIWQHTPHGVHAPRLSGRLQQHLRTRIGWFDEELASGHYCGPEPESTKDLKSMRRLERRLKQRT